MKVEEIKAVLETIRRRVDVGRSGDFERLLREAEGGERMAVSNFSKLIKARLGDITIRNIVFEEEK